MDAHNFHGSHMWNLNNIREDDYTVENLLDEADAINSPTQAGVDATIGHGSEPGINTHMAHMFFPNDGEALPQEEITEEDERRYHLQRDYECMLKRPIQPQPHWNKSKDQDFAVMLHDKTELVLRKKFSHAQDILLKCMQELKEKCDIEGFAYGIIQKKGMVASDSSNNLCSWWKEKVQFDCNGPLAIAKYRSENDSDGTIVNREAGGPGFLFELHDTTLGFLLSTLMRYCDPPQRMFPLEKGILPPWWPTGGEEWWPQLRMPKNLGAPPYKKPHNLRKPWKISVLTAVVKHMIPNVHNFTMLVNSSKFLVERMSSKEISIWLRHVEYEVKLYMQQHLDVQLPLSTLRREHGSLAFNCSSEYDAMKCKQDSMGFQDLDFLGEEGNISGDRKRKRVATDLGLNQAHVYNYQIPNESRDDSVSYSQMMPSGVYSSSNNYDDDISGLGVPGDGQQGISGLMGYYNHNVRPDESLLNPAELTNFQHPPEMAVESNLYRQNHEVGVSMFEELHEILQPQHVPTSKNIAMEQDYGKAHDIRHDEGNLYPDGIQPAHMMPMPQGFNTSNDYGNITAAFGSSSSMNNTDTFAGRMEEPPQNPDSWDWFLLEYIN